MADTIGNMVTRVLRRTLQNPNKTSFSDSDDTQLIVDYLNEASQMLRDLCPTTVDADAGFAIPVNTRAVSSPVTGLDLYDIYAWSWQYISASGSRVPLIFTSTEFIYETYPNFRTDSAVAPRYFYFDNGQIAFYPLIKTGSPGLTGTFKYPALAVRKTLFSDSFPYPNNWLLWMERYAQYMYETTKGLGNPPVTAVLMEQSYGTIFGKVKKTKRIGFKAYRSAQHNAQRLNSDDVW